MEIGKATKMKNAEKKKRTFWRELLAQLCSQIVSFLKKFFCFLCFFNFCMFAENTIKIGVSAPPPPPPKKKNNNNKFYKLKTGPNIS